MCFEWAFVLILGRIFLAALGFSSSLFLFSLFFLLFLFLGSAWAFVRVFLCSCLQDWASPRQVLRRACHASCVLSPLSARVGPSLSLAFLSFFLALSLLSLSLFFSFFLSLSLFLLHAFVKKSALTAMIFAVLPHSWITMANPGLTQATYLTFGE